MDHSFTIPGLVDDQGGSVYTIVSNHAVADMADIDDKQKAQQATLWTRLTNNKWCTSKDCDTKRIADMI